MAGLRAMNEPVLHTLKPLEEDEDEDNSGEWNGEAATESITESSNRKLN